MLRKATEDNHLLKLLILFNLFTLDSFYNYKSLILDGLFLVCREYVGKFPLFSLFYPLNSLIFNIVCLTYVILYHNLCSGL